MHHQASLGYLFLSFLKIGSTSFGGFMALISSVENRFVNIEKRIEHRDMLDAISLATMLPGAVAVNVVAYVGYRLRGVTGAVISVVSVVLPSFVLILLLAYFYQKWGEIPSVSNIFSGFLPAVCAVILATAWNLGRKTVVSWKQGLLTAAAAVALLVQGGFLVTVAVILLSGIAGILIFPLKPGTDEPAAPAQHNTGTLKAFVPLPLILAATSLSVGKLGTLAIVFGGMILMLFGGGYVFIPLIQQVVVDGYGWVSQREFVDAVAMGQITPGPILISATFIGYKVADISGAIVATVAIFGPCAVLMLIGAHQFGRLQKLTWFQSALRGVRPAIIGLIVAAAVVIARSAPLNTISLAIFGVALFLLLRFRIPVAAIIVPAGVAGWALY